MDALPGLAFVDVDTQFDFMHQAGKLYVEGAEELLSNLERLAGFARERSIPVIHTADAHRADDPEFDEFGQHCVDGSAGARRIDVTREDDAPVFTPEERADEAALAAGRVAVFKKRTLGPMTNPNVERAIEARGLDRFVVYGVATDYCVKLMALNLLDAGHRVEVVTDAVRAIAPDAGAEALAEMTARGARLVTTDEVIEAGGWVT